jgi:hypothetical protein
LFRHALSLLPVQYGIIADMATEIEALLTCAEMAAADKAAIASGIAGTALMEAAGAAGLCAGVRGIGYRLEPA